MHFVRFPGHTPQSVLVRRCMRLSPFIRSEGGRWILGVLGGCTLEVFILYVAFWPYHLL